MGSEKSYARVVKSSSIMGGAAGLTMLFQMVRVKVTAVLFGPLGAGIFANFMVVQNLVGTLTGFGLRTSAVKSIAELNNSPDKEVLATIVLSLRRVSFLIGLLGAVVVFLLSDLLSTLLFKQESYAEDISLISIALFFTAVSGGEMAIIQGMRQISNLAKIQIISGFIATLAVVLLYYYVGVDGIVFGVIAISFIQFVVVVAISHRIHLPNVKVTWLQSLYDAEGMMRLGVAFMWTNLIVVGVLFATNMLISNQISIEAVGIFSAAFALSGMFINFVLTAMQADYYPRLVEAGGDKELLNQMVNEQTEIGLLLVVPGLILTLDLAPWLIQLFYASSFLASVDLLQWFILGCFLRVIQWPMGFLQVALGKAKLYAAVQTLFAVVHLFLIWVGLHYFGLVGVSIAFCFLYVFSLGLILYISRVLTGFSWSRSLQRMLAWIVPVVLLTLILVKFLSLYLATIVCTIIFLAVTIYCLRNLVDLLGEEHRITKFSRIYLGKIV